MSEQEKDPTAQPVEPAGVSRRKFVTTVAVTGAGLTIVPRHVLGRGFQAPSDTVNIATVGIGGMGASNTRALMSQNIVAACDVDYGLLEAAMKRYQAELARMQGATRLLRASVPARSRSRRRTRTPGARRRTAPRT